MDLQDNVWQHLASGLTVKYVSQLTGLSIKDVENLRLEMPQDQEGICRTVSNKERLKRYGQEIPDRMRLGWTCNVKYCWNPRHFCLEDRGDNNFRNYKAIRARLNELEDGEWFDLLEEPNDQTSLLKFRVGLQTSGTHFLVRGLPRRTGVRIIRCDSISYGSDRTDYLRFYPNMSSRRKPSKSGQPPHAFYLGLLWNCSEFKFECSPQCSIKACPYPALNGATCRRHTLAELDLQYDRNLDKEDMLRSKDYPHLFPLFHTDWIGKDRTNFINVYKEHNHIVTRGRSKEERMNDQWWQENVILKGLITNEDGILNPIDSEEELNQRLEAVTVESSTQNIRNFFGGNGQASGFFKMRRGGGRGKIRKKQRSRVAGWHGSRDDTKSNKPNRETIEVDGEWESDSNNEGIFLEDDYSEDSFA